MCGAAASTHAARGGRWRRPSAAQPPQSALLLPAARPWLGSKARPERAAVGAAAPAGWPPNQTACDNASSSAPGGRRSAQ
eukprot:96999-Chlamydomonas_euryale.AAC.1